MTNGILLKHLFQLAEADNQDEKVTKLLSDSIKECYLTHTSAKLTFHNKIIVLVTYSFDSYQLYISDSSFYENEDNAFTRMGEDRVLHYLKSIAQFQYNWRNYVKT